MYNPVSQSASRGFLALAIFCAAAAAAAWLVPGPISLVAYAALFMAAALLGALLVLPLWSRIDSDGGVCARLLGLPSTRSKGTSVDPKSRRLIELAGVLGFLSVYPLKALGLQPIFIVAVAGGLGSGLCGLLGVRFHLVERDVQRKVDAGLLPGDHIPAPRPPAVVRIWRNASTWERALYVGFPSAIVALFVVIAILHANSGSR